MWISFFLACARMCLALIPPPTHTHTRYLTAKRLMLFTHIHTQTQRCKYVVTCFSQAQRPEWVKRWVSLTQHLLIYADQKQTPNNTASNEKQQERKEEQFSHGTRRTQRATDPCSTSHHFHMTNLKLIKILTPLWWFSAANKDLKSFFP